MARKRGGVRLAVLGAAAVLAAGVCAFASPKSDEMLKHFNLGKKLFDMGKTEEAKAEFAKMIALQPTGADAFAFREAVGRNQLVSLMAEPAFRKEMIQILQSSYDYFENLRKDEANTKKYVKQMASKDSRESWKAIYALERIGPFAVPHLLDYLPMYDAPDEDPAPVSAAIVMKMMGARAVPALAQALKADTRGKNAEEQAAAMEKDARLKIEICKLLAASRDRRALPALLALKDNPKTTPPVARMAATAALTIWQGMKAGAEGKALPATEAAQLELADLYCRNAPEVVDVVAPYDRVVWRWRENGEPSYAGRLIADVPPDFMYGRLMAQRVLVDAMASGSTGPQTLALYVANNYMLFRIAEATAGNEKADKALREAAAARAKALLYVHELNEQLGAKYLYLALARALDTDDVALAMDCIAGLRAVNDPRDMAEKAPLFRALVHRVRGVRMAAAEAALRVWPEGRMMAAAAAKPGERPGQVEIASEDRDRVIQGVYELLTLGGRPRAMVFTPSKTIFDGVAGMARGWGIETEQALEVTAALDMALRPAPAVDFILADARAPLDLFLHDVRKDIRTKRLPVILLAPAKDAEKLAKDSGLAVVAYDEKEVMLPSALKEAVDKVVAQAKSERLEADEALLRRALTSLVWTSKETLYPVRVLGPALIALLKEKPPAVAAVSLEVLELLEERQAFEPACRMFLNKDTPKELRLGAGKLMGRLMCQETAMPPALEKALRDMAVSPEDDLRRLALHALAKASLGDAERCGTAVRAAEMHLNK